MNKRLIKLEDLKVMNTDIVFIPETGSYISKEIFFDFSEESKQIKKQTIECDKYSFITDLFSICCAYTKSEEYFIRRGRNFIKQNTNYSYSDIFFDSYSLELIITQKTRIMEYPIKSLNISGSHPGNVANFYGKISQKHHNLYIRLQEGK